MMLPLAMAISGWFLAVPLLLGFGLLLVAGIVKSSFKINTKPTFIELPDDTPLPEPLRAAIEAWDPELQRLGYTRKNLLACDDMQPNSSMVLRFYLSQSEPSAAMIASIEARAKHAAGEHIIANTFVEFSGDLVDGTCVTAGNAKEVGFGPRGPDRVMLVLPKADVKTVHAIYCKAIAMRGPLKPLEPGLTINQYAERSVMRFVNRCVKHGYLQAPGEHGVARITWKGAIIGTVTNIPPMLQLWRWLGLREARALAAQVAP
jgi:hypothetical protein